MTTGNALSFGNYLRSFRLEKRISLENISRETKIGLRNLIHIEMENHDKLPAEVFVKGYLQAYADVVGVNKSEVIRLYSSSLNIYKKIADSKSKPKRADSKLWLKLPLSFLIIASVIILSVLSADIFQEKDLTKDRPDRMSAIETGHADRKGPVQKIGSSTKTDKTFNFKHERLNPERLLLEVTAVENTWIKVIIDNLASKEYRLNSEDRLKFYALSQFNILVGGAKMAKFKLNGKPIKVPGKNGQMVNLVIP